MASRGTRTPAGVIAFRARLQRPADVPRHANWTFLLVPAGASAKLPSRGIVSVEGTLKGKRFRANLQPDGNRSHWLKVPRSLQTAASATAGEMVDVTITPSAKQLEDTVPSDLRKALAGAPEASAVWRDITPIARRDWILWITTAKTEATRARRIDAACDMLGGGKRRVCCFDRSGAYSKSFSAPKARN